MNTVTLYQTGLGALITALRVISALAGFLLCLPGLSFALEEDRMAAIHIEADQVDIDTEQGSAQYRGNVKISKGSINIQADNVTVFISEGQLDRAIVQSEQTLSSFRQQINPQRWVHGQAKEITFYQGNANIILKGDATLNDGINKISGPFIQYDIDKHRIVADNADQKDERVKIIFLPNSEPVKP